MSGKGSAPRNLGPRFHENYGAINWNHKKENKMYDEPTIYLLPNPVPGSRRGTLSRVRLKPHFTYKASWKTPCTTNHKKKENKMNADKAIADSLAGCSFAIRVGFGLTESDIKDYCARQNKKTRAFIQIAALLPIAIVALVLAAGYEGYKVFQPGRNKTKTDAAAVAVVQTQAQTVTVDQQAAAIKAAVDTSNAAHAAAEASHAKVDADAAGGVYGTQEFLWRGDTKGAQAANAVAWAALGDSLTPSQKKVWDTLVAANAADAAALAERDKTIATLQVSAAADHAALGVASAHAKASDAALTSLTVEHAKTTKQLVATATTASKLTQQVQAWADNSETLWDRIKALGYLSVILGVLVFLILVKLVGVQKALGDAVALGEYVKGEAIKAGHDAVSLEAKIVAWWEGDAKGAAKIQAVKTNVLRQ